MVDSINANDNNGRKVKAVFWPDSDDEKGRCCYANQRGVGELIFSSSYHGDRDEHWIVELKDGKEVARHNTRFIETIQWA